MQVLNLKTGLVSTYVWALGKGPGPRSAKAIAPGDKPRWSWFHPVERSNGESSWWPCSFDATQLLRQAFHEAPPKLRVLRATAAEKGQLLAQLQPCRAQRRKNVASARTSKSAWAEVLAKQARCEADGGHQMVEENPVARYGGQITERCSRCGYSYTGYSRSI